MSVPNFVEIG